MTVTSFEDLERFDSHADMRNLLRLIAEHKGEWAGIPMPLETHRLVLEPTYPYPDLRKLGKQEEPADENPEGWEIVNKWWSHEERATIFVLKNSEGRRELGKHFGVHHFEMDFLTMAAMDAWGIEQESKAVALLATLLRHRAFKSYMLTGMFIETSKRSGVTYVFRRLRPTLALTSRHPSWSKIAKHSTYSQGFKILACLCLHPIGYYAGSWGGALCPTDDIIAHLMMMRGDEALFWKRANQIPAYMPEAGL